MIRAHLDEALAGLAQLESEHASAVGLLMAVKGELQVQNGELAVATSQGSLLAEELARVGQALEDLRSRVIHEERGVVEVRICSGCGTAFPEWESVTAPSACPSCRLRASSPDIAGAASVELRHDTPADTVAAATAYEAIRGLARTETDAVSWAESWPEWVALPSWRMSWYIESVRAIAAGVVKTAEMAHGIWVAARRAEGWRIGRSFDPFALRHPSLVEWTALPEPAKRGQRLFFAVAASLSSVE